MSLHSVGDGPLSPVASTGEARLPPYPATASGTGWQASRTGWQASGTGLVKGRSCPAAI